MSENVIGKTVGNIMKDNPKTVAGKVTGKNKDGKSTASKIVGKIKSNKHDD